MLVIHACNPSTWEVEIRRIVVQANLGKQLTARTKGTGGVPQVVKDLL
jgi:hypothetical protein